MKHHEKKYRVKNFSSIKQKLIALHAQKIKHAITTHYYAHTSGNDVIKLVHYADKDEIHKLAESNGTFTLTDTIPVKDIEAGLRWLKDNCNSNITEVKMDYDEYSYKGGVIGLYTINDSIYSVILDFPYTQHESIEKEFNLDTTEIIHLPYNKYLEKKEKS